MKIRTICLVAALSLLLCATASADYLQTADEALADGVTQAEEMRDFVYASGAAQDPLMEMRRLYIWDYYLNIEREKLGLEQGIYKFVYDEMNKDGQLDHLSDYAYTRAMEANVLAGELARDKNYTDQILSGGAANEKADRMAQSLPVKESKDRSYVLFWAAAMAVMAALTAFLMCRLSRLARRGIGGMAMRDLRRSLLKGRWIILSAAVVFAVLAGLLFMPKEVAKYQPLPAADGEYAVAVEELMEYCDRLAEQDPDLADKLRNVKRYQLSSAMGEILNFRVEKNPGDAVDYYKARAEKHRGESLSLNTAGWQSYTSAMTGPKERYYDQIMNYIGQALDAQLKNLDADYCDNMAKLLMESGGKTDKDAASRVEALIASAKSRLQAMTAPASSGSGRPLAAAMAGFALGAAAAAAAVAAFEMIRLALLRRKQRLRTAASASGSAVEQVNFRG